MAASREPDAIFDAEGPAALPRRNGELVFAAPWESRAFAMAVALHERGLFAWDEFRVELIAAIAAQEREHPGDAGDSYWACWLEALERLLCAKKLCTSAEIPRVR